MSKVWKKVGKKRILFEKYGKTFWLQDYINPRTKNKDEYLQSDFGDCVGVLAVTKNGKIVLGREFMHGAGTVLELIPAGVINKGETPTAAAIRELREETGYKAKSIKEVGIFYTSTRNSTTTEHCFLALGCEKVGKQNLDEEEDIDVVEVPVKTWLSRVKSGKVKNALSVITTMLSFPVLEKSNFRN